MKFLLKTIKTLKMKSLSTYKKALLFILFSLSFSFSATKAQDFPTPQNPPRIVNDFAGILNSDELNALENKLVRFNDSTSTQIAVVIIDDLNGYDPSEYAISLGEKWGVGQKGKDNGIVILIKPKKGNERGQVFIATGKGLEGVIPDAIANRITDVEMIPRFKNGDYYGAIDAATDVLESLALQEFSAGQYAKKTEAKKAPIGLALFVLFIVMLLVFVVPAFKARSYAQTNNLGFWAAFFLLMNSGRSGGSYNHFSNGTGGFGGFGGGSGFGGGGGFGGFGGGGFGGGGAGGSW